MSLFNFKRKRVLWGLVISIIVALAIDMLYISGNFETLELMTFDMRSKAVREDKLPHPDVEIIMIDDDSIKWMDDQVGRWPWPRDLWGDLIDYLSMGGARAVIFDVIFAQHEIDDPEIEGLGESDQILVQATHDAGNIYHAANIFVDLEDEGNKDLLNEALPEDFVDKFSVKNIKKGDFLTGPANNYELPIDELYRVSKNIGVVSFQSDDDGVYRRTPLFSHYGEDSFPVLSMAYILDALAPINITKKEGNLYLDKLAIPVLEDETYLINMYKNFKPYSIGGIFNSILQLQEGQIEDLDVSPEEFKNKIVLVGASAIGVEDLKQTSIGTDVPGVILHASLISNILQKDFLRAIPETWKRIIIYALSVLCSFLIIILASIYLQVLFPIVMGVVYAIAANTLFERNIVIDLVPPILSIFAVWLTSFAYLYFTEGRARKKVRTMLGQYVSPAVLTELVGSSGDYLQAEVGRTEKLTILFSDIRGFTSISEKMEAKDVVSLLNKYLSSMVDVIFHNQGTLDKFSGDAIMAFWGAPIRVSDHGKMAVKAALEMTKALEQLNADFVAQGYPPFKTGVGLHTGDVVLGNIGSEKKLDYTIIGDNVNLTSRLEGLTKEYGVSLLISEETYKELNGEFICRIADHVKVKGKNEPIRIYSVVGMTGESTEESELNQKICRYSEVAFNKYLNRQFEEALEMNIKLKKFIRDDRISEIFINRCREYIQTPPPEEWDGIFTMKTK